jgi:hypothetical protein
MLPFYGNEDVSLSTDCQPQIICTGYLRRAEDILNTRDELLHGKIYKATSTSANPRIKQPTRCNNQS